MEHVRNYADQLEEAHPGWQIWWVPRAIGGYHWCAAPPGAATSTLVKDSPAQLDEAIIRAEEGQ
jgi:hypothetical protein